MSVKPVGLRDDRLLALLKIINAASPSTTAAQPAVISLGLIVGRLSHGTAGGVTLVWPPCGVPFDEADRRTRRIARGWAATGVDCQKCYLARFFNAEWHCARSTYADAMVSAAIFAGHAQIAIACRRE